MDGRKSDRSTGWQVGQSESERLTQACQVRDCLGTTGRKDTHARHNYTLSIPPAMPWDRDPSVGAFCKTHPLETRWGFRPMCRFVDRRNNLCALRSTLQWLANVGLFVSSPETQNIRRRWGWRPWNQQRISGVEAPELQKWTQFLPPSAKDLDSTYGVITYVLCTRNCHCQCRLTMAASFGMHT
ncbi:conserved hypothetical protein [Coccidioides posadasii str. Silveira]|uniref:Uncharacterized protein n=1 Tax=Coccidioides posadasii (strain RMSCC 757 / Silveira) TaxID=443226 RepID=E9CRE4_COCPS|nr:conserved hypothetical protein [Coccidioides posadasii str. Silveira]